MEIPIVNKDDEIIGHKERDDLDLENDIVRSSSLWITNGMGQVLLAQRKMTKRTNPGKWAEAVGGTVDGSDDYDTTVYREAAEELGISGEVFTIGPKQFVAGPPANYFVQWYRANLDWPIEEFTPQENEIEEVAWFDKNMLEIDIKDNPDKYITELSEIVGLLV